MALLRILLFSFLCTLFVYQCHGACAEVDSDTEAVAGKGFKLGCISCKRRSEVEGAATIEWYFRAKGEADFVLVSVPIKRDLWSRKCGQKGLVRILEDCTGARPVQSSKILTADS